MIRKQHPIVFSLSAGSGAFAISGVFYGESTLLLYTVGMYVHVVYYCIKHATIESFHSHDQWPYWFTKTKTILK